MSDNFEQINLFEGITPYYKVTKPIRLIEFFAGIGSQHQALKNLGVTIDRSTIVEWQVNSIQAYNDIHIRKYDDWTSGMTKEDLANKLFAFGVSINYEEPASLATLLRKGEDWLRNVYNNIINTNNKVNISNVKAQDLDIVDTDKFDYILTYSYPCQDLSIAGLKKGMRDTSTRSGLLWEVERILQEAKKLGNLPQVLLMENVPDVINYKHLGDFQRWIARLEELGYSNHFKIINAKEFGIPQNRDRAFMVSILGDYLYNFPKPIGLTLRLKDMLEDEVDEKYYLTQDKIDAISHWKSQQKPFSVMENTEITGISPCLTARGAGEEHGGMILIKDSTNKGYAEAQDGDGVWIHNPHRKGGVVTKQSMPTLVTGTGDYGVVVSEPKLIVTGNVAKNGRESGNVFSTEGIAPTLLARDGKDPKKISQTNELRIRKLTPRECYRLMGFSDEAYDLASPNQSNTALYHQAGDSIVVNVLENIFKEIIK